MRAAALQGRRALLERVRAKRVEHRRLSRADPEHELVLGDRAIAVRVQLVQQRFLTRKVQRG
eukprot:6201112-Pleurochrysis_carterae.AAC.1